MGDEGDVADLVRRGGLHRHLRRSGWEVDYRSRRRAIRRAAPGPHDWRAPAHEGSSRARCRKRG
jgi:hypothetical protein